MTRSGLILGRWPLWALIASAAMLAIAHAFETFGGYAPCTLCLRQREVYWAAGTIALAGAALVWIRPQRPWRVGIDLLLAAVFLIGAVVAGYHAGAEWKLWPGPSACAAAGGLPSAEDMAAMLAGAQVRGPSCDEAPWIFAGLSMAGWNVVVSLALVLASLYAARRERR